MRRHHLEATYVHKRARTHTHALLSSCRFRSPKPLVEQICTLKTLNIPDRKIREGREEDG